MPTFYFSQLYVDPASPRTTSPYYASPCQSPTGSKPTPIAPPPTPTPPDPSKDLLTVAAAVLNPEPNSAMLHWITVKVITWRGESEAVDSNSTGTLLHWRLGDSRVSPTPGRTCMVYIRRASMLSREPSLPSVVVNTARRISYLFLEKTDLHPKIQERNWRLYQ
jgi:hypothetical protein